MFNTYIKAANGIMKWLFFIVLNLVGPFVRGIGAFLLIGGIVTFLFMLWTGLGRTGFDAAVNGLSIRHAMFFGFVCAVLGMAMVIYCEIITDRMYLDRLYPAEKQDDGISRLVWLRNWFGVLVLFVGFSFAAYYRYPSLYGFDWPAIGFAWWLAVGVTLGVCRWLYRQGSSTMSVIAELVSKVRNGLASKSVLTNEEVRTATKAFVEINKVVPFRKKG